MSQKKFYVIYQITNNLNGKIYIGKHKTNNLDDDYFGSGKFLKRAQKKYGLENFTKTILFYLQNEDEMNLLEKMVVTKEVCDRDDVYNINTGGDGGWNYVNLSSDFRLGSEQRRESFHVAGGKASQKVAYDKFNMSLTAHNIQQMTDDQYDAWINSISASLKKFRENNPDAFSNEKNPMFGKHHSDKTKQLLSENLSGENNGSYGKHWYKNPNSSECKMFFEGEQPEGWILGMYQSGNQSSSTKGKIKLVSSDFSKSIFVYPDDADELTESGEWERKRKPMSEKGRANVREAAKTRKANYAVGISPKNKGKIKFINVITNEISYFDPNELIPDSFVPAKGNVKCCINSFSNKRIYIYIKNDPPEGYSFSKTLSDKYETLEEKIQIRIDKHNAYIKETQEMADYYMLYGYEETCKKFPGRKGTCSPESMLMRFIRARKLYGIHFESQSGKPRRFLKTK